MSNQKDKKIINYFDYNLKNKKESTKRDNILKNGKEGSRCDMIYVVDFFHKKDDMLEENIQKEDKIYIPEFLRKPYFEWKD